jgi:CheY-like chemotaxis protein
MPSREKTILVVEDDFSLRQALCAALEEAGFRTVGAADGFDALNRLRGGPKPDMILTDLGMPKMDGWAFAEELAKDPALGAIPVLVLSGQAVNALSRATLKAVELVMKPFELDSLVARIVAHFDESTAGA